MSDAIAEQTTTLPEGATVSVARMSGKRPYTEIRAWRDGKVVKMRGDAIPPQNLPTYLTLTVNAINRERALLTAKPPEPATAIHSVKDFVLHMAHNDMFIFDLMTPEAAVEAPGLSDAPRVALDVVTGEPIHFVQELADKAKKKRKPTRIKKDNEPF